MSTRATIKIKQRENSDVYLYHHCDGYPEGVGNDLKEYLNVVIYWDSEELVNNIIKGDCGNDNFYEFTFGQHGDEEYAYLIDCDNKSLTCYKVGWDEFDWKESNIIFDCKYE